MIIDVVVYGAEKKCASCVNLPSSKETMEWLEALLSRKYPEESLQFQYVDIENPKQEYEQFSTEIIEEDRFYPLVTINGEVVAEGDPKLKHIYKTMNHLIENKAG